MDLRYLAIRSVFWFCLFGVRLESQWSNKAAQGRGNTGGEMSDEYEDDFDEYDEDFEEDSSDSDEDSINGNMEKNKNINTEVTGNNNNIGDDIMMDSYDHENDSSRNPKL